jgi:hypothetical protein
MITGSIPIKKALRSNACGGDREMERLLCLIPGMGNHKVLNVIRQ